MRVSSVDTEATPFGKIHHLISDLFEAVGEPTLHENVLTVRSNSRVAIDQEFPYLFQGSSPITFIDSSSNRRVHRFFTDLTTLDLTASHTVGFHLTPAETDRANQLRATLKQGLLSDYRDDIQTRAEGEAQSAVMRAKNANQSISDLDESPLEDWQQEARDAVGPLRLRIDPGSRRSRRRLRAGLAEHGRTHHRSFNKALWKECPSIDASGRQDKFSDLQSARIDLSTQIADILLAVRAHPHRFLPSALTRHSLRWNRASKQESASSATSSWFRQTAQ